MRKSIAVLLVAWLTIFSQVAVAMPFCERARSQGHSDASPAGHAEHTAGHDQDRNCPQHRDPQDHRGKLACDACALCHVACNVIPSLKASLATGPLGHVFFAASNPSAITFVPETPQPVPVAILV